MADLINRYPDRFLFGTDEVAPTDQGAYLKAYDMYQPMFARLTPDAKQKLLKGNYERLFDEARRKVRAWEAAHREVTRTNRSRIDTQDDTTHKETAGMRADNRHLRQAHWGIALAMLLITATGAWAQTNTTPPPPATATVEAPPPAANRRQRRRKAERRWRSTALRCSTSARTSRPSTRTGSTPCGSPSCRPSKVSTAKT